MLKEILEKINEENSEDVSDQLSQLAEDKWFSKFGY